MKSEEAYTLGHRIDEVLNAHGWNTAICGSLRRGKSEVGDVDMVVWERENVNGNPIILLTNHPGAKEHKRSTIDNYPDPVTIPVMIEGTKVDVFMVRPQECGAAMLFLTGSREFGRWLEDKAKAKGLGLTPTRLWDNEENLAWGKTEGEILDMLGVGWVAPAERERGKGEGE